MLSTFGQKSMKNFNLLKSSSTKKMGRC